MDRIAQGNSPSARTLFLLFALCFLPITAITCHAQTYNVLYNFSLAAGSIPEGQIASDKAGNIYGVTVEGGANNFGAVYELSPPSAPGGNWTEAVLYSFDNTSANGSYPEGGITTDKLGNLYGTTTQGGGTPCRCGTVFELKPPAVAGGAWRFRTLHHFEGAPTDGSDPQSPLTVDSSGNVYGTTYTGGLYNNSSQLLGGVAFKLSPAGSGWTEIILRNFGGTGSFRPYARRERQLLRHQPGGRLRRLRQRLRTESAFRRRHGMDRKTSLQLPGIRPWGG